MNNFSLPSPHYESSYLKRTLEKPPPSLANLQKSGQHVISSGASISSLPVTQNASIHRSGSFHSVQPQPNSTPLHHSIRNLRSQSPIDMILENAKNRSATPLGTRQAEEMDNRSTASPSPLSIYRSPSPIPNIRSSASPLLSLRSPSPLLASSYRSPSPLSHYRSPSPYSMGSVAMGRTLSNRMTKRQFNQSIMQRRQSNSELSVDVPTTALENALSPDSQDAFIGIKSPENVISPSSQTTGHHSALTEVRKHSSTTIDKPNPKDVIRSLPHEKPKSKENRTESLNSVIETRQDSESMRSKRDIKKRRGKTSKAIVFDPEAPGLYWTQLAVRVSSEILKFSTKNQKFAEAAQMAIIKAGENYSDASPEIINIVASKASMAVLEAGGDARIAAMATVAILNAEDDSPSTEEEVRMTMVELYGSARQLVKKGYEDSSEVLTKVSEMASTTLKGVTSQNIKKYQEYRDKVELERKYGLPPHHSTRSRPSSRSERGRQTGLLDMVDDFIDDIRDQYDRAQVRRYNERGPRKFSQKGRSLRGDLKIPVRSDYKNYSSDEDNEGYGRSRRSSSRRLRSRSSSSSFSDEDSVYDRRYKSRSNSRRSKSHRSRNKSTSASWSASSHSIDSAANEKSRSRSSKSSVSSDSKSSTSVSSVVVTSSTSSNSTTSKSKSSKESISQASSRESTSKASSRESSKISYKSRSSRSSTGRSRRRRTFET
mmetsp:Transcript_22690/g.26299  ORF Transcript_22690/g.26299 Transcript_22690/m.26299 type:complete len:714 (-) Transcript_22690:80-2221(-)